MTPDPRAFYNDRMPDKHGEDYEYARWHASAMLEAQYEMMTATMRNLVLPNVSESREVLEVGPGPGTWTKLLRAANPSARYTLLDISREMLARARNALSEETGITYIEEDFLSYRPGITFDYFFSSRALEYMKDKDAAARVISGLLAPGGEGVIITKMPKALFYRLRGKKIPEFHTGQIAPGALSKSLRQAGLEIISVRIATATLPGIASAPLNRFLYRVLASVPLVAPLTAFAESYAVRFRKP